MANRISAAIIIMSMVLCMAYGQQRPGAADQNTQAKTASEKEVVFDDDGGRVFIVGRKDVSFADLSNHGGAVINQPLQVNVFLGKAWSRSQNRSRETLFSDPTALLDAAGREFISQRQIQFAGSEHLSQEALDFSAPGSTVSDLQVQEVLSNMFESRWLYAPDASTIYVVFLPPGLQSTLGDRIGGKHYVAYHNYVHFNGVQVHYVVAPFETDPKTAQRNVARAIIDTALNPGGDGWY